MTIDRDRDRDRDNSTASRVCVVPLFQWFLVSDEVLSGFDVAKVDPFDYSNVSKQQETMTEAKSGASNDKKREDFSTVNGSRPSSPTSRFQKGVI